ncbi:hypothetical protein RUM44_004927 [Polyplax serrata]|uniref:Uncharacterized protein n=1 Tax=Polyplax serrata TaxID=468196 RepID=A0ABR1B466_POLSC
MRSLQFTSLVILAVFAVEVFYELHVSDSYREDTYGKAIVNINSQEVFNDNVVKYKMEKTHDYDQTSTTTVVLTMKLGEENSACNVKLNYKRKSTMTIKQTEDKAKVHPIRKSQKVKMRSFQFIRLVLLVALTVDILSELRVSGSYGEGAFRKVVAYINSQEFFKENMANYKLESPQYEQASNTTFLC